MKPYLQIVIASILSPALHGTALSTDIVDLDDVKFSWREINWNQWERSGLVTCGKGKAIPFTIGMRFASRDSGDYLRKTGLERRHVHGISPGEITVITHVRAMIDGKEFILPSETFARVVNPKTEKISIKFSEEHQFLITFNGPDASESYVCQINLTSNGFVSGAIRSWVGGKGFGQTSPLTINGTGITPKGR